MFVIELIGCNRDNGIFSRVDLEDGEDFCGEVEVEELFFGDFWMCCSDLSTYLLCFVFGHE